MAMRKEERAAQVWPLLAWAARSRQILTYDDVEKLTGLVARGVGKTALGPIIRYCKNKDYPILTVIVVKKNTGLPGPGIESLLPKDKFLKEQMKVFKFDWMEDAEPPTPEILKKFT